MIPNFLLEKLNQEYGNQIVQQIVAGYSLKRPTTFRVNSLKATKKDILDELRERKIEIEEGIISNSFIFRGEKNQLEKTNAYQEGKIYVQSLSSMLPAILLDPQEHTDILDMAAAPGGKTTMLAALTDNKANITACEMNAIRAERLKYNLEKQGATSVYLLKEDARNLNSLFSFDQILLDAPCSGSGTIQADDPDNEKYFTLKLVEKSMKLQEQLLRKAIRLLKPNHTMIYSTCSILKEENEEILSKVLRNHQARIIPLQENEIKNIPQLPSTIDGVLTIAPNEQFEGFFIAKIQKK